jgi:hypothetical protein
MLSRQTVAELATIQIHCVDVVVGVPLQLPPNIQPRSNLLVLMRIAPKRRLSLVIRDCHFEIFSSACQSWLPRFVHGELARVLEVFKSFGMKVLTGSNSTKSGLVQLWANSRILNFDLILALSIMTDSSLNDFFLRDLHKKCLMNTICLTWFQRQLSYRINIPTVSDQFSLSIDSS